MAGRKEGTRGVYSPMTMEFFRGGTSVGRLKAIILRYSKRYKVPPSQAAKRVMERMAVDSKRATYVKGVTNARVHVHGRQPKDWPKKLEP